MGRTKRLLLMIGGSLVVGFLGLILDEMNISSLLLENISNQGIRDMMIGVVGTSKGPLFAIGGYLAGGLKDYIELYLSRKDKEEAELPHVSILTDTVFGPRRGCPEGISKIISINDEEQCKSCYYVFCKIVNQSTKDVLHISINGVSIASRLSSSESHEFAIKLPNTQTDNGIYRHDLLLLCQNEMNVQYEALYRLKLDKSDCKASIRIKQRLGERMREANHD